MNKRVTNFDLLNELTNSNIDLIRKYILIFLNNSPKIIAELQQKIRENDHSSIKQFAHTLKPQVSYMGMEKEKELLEKIEQLSLKKEDINKIIPLFNSLELAVKIAYDELNEFLSNTDVKK